MSASVPERRFHAMHLRETKEVSKIAHVQLMDKGESGSLAKWRTERQISMEDNMTFGKQDF